MLTHHERCGSLQTASPPVGVCFQNPSLASLLPPRAHSWQQDTKEVRKEGRGIVKLPTEWHTPHWNRCGSSMTPLYFPPSRSGDAILSCSASGLSLLLLRVSKSALPCVISHRRCAEQSSVLCCALAAILIKPRVMDQVSAPPSGLLIQSRLNEQLQLKSWYSFYVLFTGRFLLFPV